MIYLDGPVADSGVPESIWHSDVVRALEHIDHSNPLVLISSFGGSLFEALSIFRVIRSTPMSITTRVRRIAASAGAVIAMAGHRVEMEEDAFLMLHGASVFCFGDREVMRQSAQMNGAFNICMAAIFSGRTKRSINYELQRLQSGLDWQMTANEALAQGYIDAIVPRSSSVISSGHT